MDIFNDPVKRAELEKDFVVIGYDPGSDTAATADVKAAEEADAADPKKIFATGSLEKLKYTEGE